jgi:hypothetical protein
MEMQTKVHKERAYTFAQSLVVVPRILFKTTTSDGQLHPLYTKIGLASMLSKLL